MSFYDNHHPDHHDNHGHHHHDHHHDHCDHHHDHDDHHHDRHHDHRHHQHEQPVSAAYYQPPPPTYYQPPPTYYQPPPPMYSHEGERSNSNRIYTKAGKSYSLSIRDNTVILAMTNPRDEYQHWYKDFRWGNEVKDEEGHRAFALINKATGLAVKHSLGATHPVRLLPFNPAYLDESILWTESHDTGKGYHSIRMVNNTRLGLDAFHGDNHHGGVHDGTVVVLWEFLNGKNQRWKIEPNYCESSSPTS